MKMTLPNLNITTNLSTSLSLSAASTYSLRGRTTPAPSGDVVKQKYQPPISQTLPPPPSSRPPPMMIYGTANLCLCHSLFLFISLTTRRHDVQPARQDGARPFNGNLVQ